VLILIVAVLLGILSVWFLALLGRRVVMPRSPKLINFDLDETGQLIRLPLSPATQSAGMHGLWFNDDTAHARIGDVASIDAVNGFVDREVVGVLGGDLTATKSGRWSGHAFARPNDVSADFMETSITTETGESPAWVFPTADSDGTWAVHVHGIRTSRFSALRSVPVALRLGMTSIVPSYFGDSDNPGKGNRPSYLGQREWRDVEMALDYAVDHGARRVVLFGWSMGASISLTLSEVSRHRDLIAGLVLVSPATNMRGTLVAAAVAAGVPSWLAGLVPFSLSHRPFSFFSGLREPVDFRALDWTQPAGRVKVPTLVIHSDGDTDIPLRITRQFADANPGMVSLVELDAVPHQLEWNSSPRQFEGEIERWVMTKGLDALEDDSLAG
jgi:pimeloyl-ACP methyl ester carboxylesterase